MTKEEYERGLELQGYRKSIADMTLGGIALKFLKEHHLPKFLKKILVKFAHPLLLLKDIDLEKAKEIIKGLLFCCRNYPQENAEKMKQAEQFLNGDGCPDTLCEDCTKKDCTVKKLGLVGKVK